MLTNDVCLAQQFNDVYLSSEYTTQRRELCYQGKPDLEDTLCEFMKQGRS